MLNGVFVGFGNIAEFGHWPAYRASGECRIVAAVELNDERRAAAAAAGLATFKAIEEVPRGEVDFVDICTPPSHHLQPMLAAIERRWHVLCEKPIVLDSGAITTLRAHAEAANVAVIPVHNWKYAPIIRRATELLNNGAIGRLRRVRLTTLRSGAAITVGNNWRHDPRLAGGGIVMDHGWHSAYLALSWFGESAREISAAMHRPRVGAAEDEAVVKLRFDAGEADIALTWNSERRGNRVELSGTEGEITIDDGVLRVNETVERFEPLSAGSHHADWFTAMLPDVLKGFGDRQEASRLFEEAAECLRIIRNAYDRATWRGDSLGIS